MNRTTNHRHNITNPRNSGRMQYAPTIGANYKMIGYRVFMWRVAYALYATA